MDDTLKKVRKLTEYMRKSGILSLKAEGIELTLSPGAIALPNPGLEPNLTPAEPEHILTEEEILFWSAPGTLPEGGH